MASAREELDLIVDKFAKQIVIANGEVLNATNITNANGYLRRTPQVIKVDEHLQALEIIVKKRVDVYLIVHSLTKEKKLDYYNIMCPMDFELTQEEYDLVSKVVKEIGNESNRHNR